MMWSASDRIFIKALMESDITAVRESDLVFWSRQLSEHALFLHLGIFDENLKSAALLLHQRWQQFRQTLQGERDKGTRVILGRFEDLARELKELQLEIIEILSNFGKNTDNNPRAWIGWIDPSFVSHITRELNYSLVKIYERPVPPADEINFWRLINKEHALFAAHLLDPSESALIRVGYEIADRIANDETCESKLFIEASLNSIAQLDVYNRTAKSLLDKNQLRSVIHPVLLTHVIREGQRALAIVERIADEFPDSVIEKNDHVFDDFSEIQQNLGEKAPDSVLSHC